MGISELDKEREHEATALQKQIEYQEERLNNAVSLAKSEMDQRFMEVQGQCQDKLDVEHARCEEQRAVHRLHVREAEPRSRDGSGTLERFARLTSNNRSGCRPHHELTECHH